MIVMQWAVTNCCKYTGGAKSSTFGGFQVQNESVSLGAPEVDLLNTDNNIHVYHLVSAPWQSCNYVQH